MLCRAKGCCPTGLFPSPDTQTDRVRVTFWHMLTPTNGDTLAPQPGGRAIPAGPAIN